MIEIYGFWVQVHHGWYNVLTVMSQAGITATREIMGEDTGTEIISQPGLLTKYIERERGALARLIDRYHIEILSRDQWNLKKQTFGDDIYR